MSYHRKYEYMSDKDIAECKSKFEKDNEYIVETAGFVPLEVKMKQFETNGLVAQFMVSDFDSNDYRDIYLNPDFNITPEDDLEEIQEKLAAQRAYAEEIKKSKVGSFEETANSPSDSAAAEKKDDSKDE